MLKNDFFGHSPSFFVRLSQRTFSFLRILRNSRPSQNGAEVGGVQTPTATREFLHCFQNQIASFSRGKVLLILDKILSYQTFACSHTSVWRKRYFGPQEGSTSDFLDFASYRKKYKSAESLNTVFGNDLPKGTLWENMRGPIFLVLSNCSRILQKVTLNYWVKIITQIISSPPLKAVETCKNVQVVEAKEWLCKTVERDL